MWQYIPEYVLVADALLNIVATIPLLFLARLGKSHSQASAKNDTYPNISIIVLSHNQEEALHQNLSSLLLQEYPANYEVIVSDEASTDETMRILEEFEASYPHLRHTLVPSSARDISLEKLAITLGIRSASYDWTILLQADCCPTSPSWLKQMAIAIQSKPHTQMVLAPVVSIRKGKKGYSYMQIWEQLIWLSHALTHRAYRTEESNVAYRKSLFLEHQGFAKFTLSEHGSIDWLVNNHSTADNTAVALHPCAALKRESLSNSLDEGIRFMDTRRHLRKPLLYFISYLSLCLSFSLVLCLMVCCTSYFIYISHPWYAIVPWIMYMAHLFIYHTTFRRAVKVLGISSPSFWSHYNTLLIPFINLHIWCKNKQTKKSFFRKKFIPNQRM